MPESSKSETHEPSTFEEAYLRLGEIVETLEAGQGGLSEMTELFEEGVRLSKYCAERLDAIERKVEILLGEGGPEEGIVPFPTEDAGRG